MQSLLYVKGSNGSGNASQMTVQTLRSPGASDILVNTVTGVPTYFYGSMGAPHTFIDPVTGETITIISEATAVDFAGHIDTGKIVIDAIAPGYVDTRGSLVGDIVVVRPVTEWANNLFNVMNQAHNDNGTLKDSAITYNPNAADHIQSGGIWATVSGLNLSMSALVAYQAGYRGTIAAVASRAFTASKDTYVDILRNTTTNALTLVYTEVANNAASPALAANSIRLGIVITGAASLTQVNQGSIKATLPLVSSTKLTVSDSLGYRIYPNSPTPKLIGYRDATAAASVGAGGSVLVPGLNLPVQVPAGRNVRVTYRVRDQYNNTSSQYSNTSIYNSTGAYTVGAGTFSNSGGVTTSGGGDGYDTPTAVAQNYQGLIASPGSGTALIELPAILLVELD